MGVSHKDARAQTGSLSSAAFPGQLAGNGSEAELL